MPYFSKRGQYNTNYFGYVADGLPDAALTVFRNPGRTTMSVGVDRWLSGDQFHQDVADIKHYGYHSEGNSETGVANRIEELQNTKRDYDKGVPFSESGLTYHHEDGVFRNADEDDQLQLFAYDPPKPSQVQFLVSRNNPGAKVAAMTMLGLADMDARAETGHPLKPSDDLSPHSLRIVRHLRDRGVVPSDDVPPSHDNDMGFHDSASYLANHGHDLEDIQHPNSEYTDISDRARLARRHIKSLLRPTKATPKPRERKPQQLKLFED